MSSRTVLVLSICFISLCVNILYNYGIIFIIIIFIEMALQLIMTVLVKLKIISRANFKNVVPSYIYI